ncbi:MAG: SH3 domain-containing protein [Lachnospiraceae bacterium]|nr:SH3 domain-containing protein [Lachnospiraceae bacterium]
MKRRNFDIREFVLGHYQYFIVGILFIVLVIVLAIFSGRHKKDEKETEAVEDTPQQEQVDVSQDVQTSENAEIPLTTEGLQVDAYPEVNALVNTYYTAIANGDIATLSTICSSLDDAAQIRIVERAKYTESYDDIRCYTKPGPIDGSYLVFAYYQIKFVNIDTRAPGLSSLYVCPNTDGSLYINNEDMPENVSTYIRGVAAQDDVVALLSQVDSEYNAAAEQDKTLKAFMDALPAKLDEAVAAQLASGQPIDTTTSTETAATEVQVKTTDAVRIRSSADDSSDANIIAKSAAGDTFTRIGEEGNWSKIKYKDTTAYIRSDFLTTAESTDTGATGTEGAATGGAGTITVTKSDVNVRNKAGTDGDILGKASNGSTYTLKGESGEWYEIDYNGQSGFIRNDMASKN